MLGDQEVEGSGRKQGFQAQGTIRDVVVFIAIAERDLGNGPDTAKTARICIVLQRTCVHTACSQ
jgi:hypothetical protein